MLSLRLGSIWHSLWNNFRNLYKRALASDFINKVGETFAAKILLLVIGLVISVFISRSLGPEGRGLFAIAAAIQAIGIQFGNLGLHASNTYFVAQNRALLPTLVSNSLLASVFAGGFGGLLLWIACVVWPPLAPLKGWLFILTLATIPLGLTSLLLQNLLLGIQQVRAFNVLEVVGRLLSVASFVILFLVNFVTTETLFVSSAAILVFTTLLSLVFIKNRTPNWAWPSWQIFQKTLRYGAKAYIAALASYLALRFDLLLVNQMLGAEHVGYYSLAISMTDYIYMLPVTIGTILFPKLSAMPTIAHKWAFARKTAILVAGMMLVITVIASLLAQPVVVLLYGSEFLPAVPAFVWLMPAIVILSINTIFMNYFASIGMPSITVYSPVSAALVNIALCVWLLPSFGIVGASVSSVATYGLMLLLSCLYLLKRRNTDARQLS
jgi:O-antigen/teichoic acid export membrane protein